MILANGCNITKSEKFKGVWILSVPTVYFSDFTPAITPVFSLFYNLWYIFQDFLIIKKMFKTKNIYLL